MQMIRIFIFIILSLSLMLMTFSSCQEKEKDAMTIEEDRSYQTYEWPSWITKDFVMGRFEPSQHKDFVIVDTLYADRSGLYLHRDTYEAFLRMWEAAANDDVKLVIRSATRNFEYQKEIWERKWNGTRQLSDGTRANQIDDPHQRALKILLYSSMPGTSRHHWGTDIDLNNFNNSYFESGEGLKEYNWLQQHSATFGFCQPYVDKSGGRTGYEEEKWHWTYQPLSHDLTLYCSRHLNNEDITGFLGSGVASSVDMLNNYILGISPQCIQNNKK